MTEKNLSKCIGTKLANKTKANNDLGNSPSYDILWRRTKLFETEKSAIENIWFFFLQPRYGILIVMHITLFKLYPMFFLTLPIHKDILIVYEYY